MKKVFKIIFNKYLVTTAAFVVWMTFFDQNDWMTQNDTRKELKETKQDIKYLTAETEKIEQDYVALVSDPKRLEQFAREHYRMKRANEDLYIIDKK